MGLDTEARLPGQCCPEVRSRIQRRGEEQICQSEGWREEKDEKRELKSGVGECGFYECKEWGNSGYAAEKEVGLLYTAVD